jgi:N-acetylmuramate 1-kinase
MVQPACLTSKIISPLERQSILSGFIKNQNLEDATCTFLAGDASFRKYYRLQRESETWVLMDAPPPEDPRSFIDVAQLLRTYGFSAPEIYQSDLDQGILLLEDLGDLTFTQAFRQGYPETPLYERAIDTLIHLHKQINHPPSFLPMYQVDDHLKEAQLLLEWYYPALYQKEPTPHLYQGYKDLWLSYLDKTSTCPQSIVLRDYHVDNLMVLSRPGIQGCGLLDFQDARWGATVYDVVSLLEDARRDIPPDLIEYLWQKYFAAFPEENSDTLQLSATILSAARHAKIIGVFTRLAVRDGKPHYLQHIPRIWRLLEQCLQHPQLAELQEWFAIHFPLRSIPCVSHKR